MTHKPIVINVSKAADEKAWQAERRKIITATDTPRIFGVAPSKWGGALSVALEKWDQAPPMEINEAMEMGEWLEPTIADRFEHEKNYKVKPSNVILVHPRHTHMGCSLDRWTEDEKDEVPLEIKNVTEYYLREWEEGIPQYYQLQVQHQLCVTGKPYAYVAALIGGNKFRIHKLYRDDRLIDTLIEETKKFWEMVQRHEAPTVDDSDEAEQVLRYLHPYSSKGKGITLDEELQEVYKKFLQARSAQKLIQVELQGYKNLLMQQMEDAENAYIPGVEKPVITYRGSTIRRFDQSRFTAENPDVAAKYYTEASSRRFLVKGEKE